MDYEFRAKLEEWFTKEGDWHDNHALMISGVEKFWTQRINHYEREATTLWAYICEYESLNTAQDSKQSYNNHESSEGTQDNTNKPQGTIGQDKAYEELNKVYLNDFKNLDDFARDWNDIKALFSDPQPLAKSLKSADEKIHPPGIGRQSYDLNNLNWDESKFTLANNFRKLIKYIRMLRTVRRAIETFKEVREQITRGKEVLKLTLLERVTGLEFDSDATHDIAKCMNNWTQPKGNQKFADERQQRFDELVAQKTFNRYFHCELQLLDMFLDDENV